MISHLVRLGHIEGKAYTQLPVFEAAIQFARTEGILPAPESAHAIRAAVDKRWPPRKRVKAKSFSSASAATAISISRRTRITSPANWWITNIPAGRLPKP